MNDYLISVCYQELGNNVVDIHYIKAENEKEIVDIIEKSYGDRYYKDVTIRDLKPLGEGLVIGLTYPIYLNERGQIGEHRKSKGI